MQSNKKAYFGFAYIAIGVIALFLSLICFSMRSAGSIKLETYGGDAYTGIQNASASTAQNISCGFGFIFIVAGLTITTKGISDYVLYKEENQDANHNAFNDIKIIVDEKKETADTDSKSGMNASNRTKPSE